MAYRLSKQAEADLIDVYLYGLAEFGVTQAEKYQNRIDETIALIGDNPKLARVRKDITPPVRIHPVAAHIIVYLIDDRNEVRILRVRHGRENWPENPFGEF